jgi:hypothetical protein
VKLLLHFIKHLPGFSQTPFAQNSLYRASEAPLSLARHVTSLPSNTFPRTEAQLIALLETTFERLTGSRLSEENAISDDGSLYVKRYARGGMPSGLISIKFWRGSALPLLPSRTIRQSLQTLPHELSPSS